MYKTINTSNTLKIEPNISYNQVKNLIGLTELVNFSRHYINLNQIKSLNFALTTSYQIQDYLQMNFGFSYLGRYLEYSKDFNSGGFMFTPSANFSLNYQYKPMNMAFNIYYKYSGKRKGHYIEEENGEDVLKEATRQDFSNLDASLSKKFFHKKWQIAIGAKNIFNVKDIETFNQIGVAHERNSQLMGSSYFIKLNYKF
jgi:outer membrane receptor for ferrienterochelin and colicins